MDNKQNSTDLNTCFKTIEEKVMLVFSDLVLFFTNPRVRDAALMVTNLDVTDRFLVKVRGSADDFKVSDIAISAALHGFTISEVIPPLLALQDLNNFCQKCDIVSIDKLDNVCILSLHRAILGILDLEAIKDVQTIRYGLMMNNQGGFYNTYVRYKSDTHTPYSILYRSMCALDEVASRLYGHEKERLNGCANGDKKRGTK